MEDLTDLDAGSDERVPSGLDVGGSIPSLATIFSSTYASVITRTRSNAFQKPNCAQRLVLFVSTISLVSSNLRV
jgi:hypothetical protein